MNDAQADAIINILTWFSVAIIIGYCSYRAGQYWTKANREIDDVKQKSKEI